MYQVKLFNKISKAGTGLLTPEKYTCADDFEDYDSIAGHVINLLSHFPEAGECAEDEFATYTVLEVNKNHIDKLKIHLKPPVEETDEEEDEEI